MRADLPTGITEASAQSLIFGALWMSNSPFLGLERKWCCKLLCNELIWGFPHNTHKEFERLGLAWVQRILPLWFVQPTGRTTKEAACLLLSMSQIFGSPKLTMPIQRWWGRRKGWGEAVGSQCQSADAFTSPENLEVLHAVVESFAIRGMWVRVLTDSLSSCVTVGK